MTQKELLYVEDAISHESIIISICEEAINNLNDDNLISFIQKDINRHTEIKNNLMNLLRGQCHE